MPTYNYKARDADARLLEGVIEAQDEAGAAGQIERLGLSPVSITSNADAAGQLGNILSGLKKVSHQELLIFTREIATLISTGAPLIQSLNNVAEQTQNKKFKQVIYSVVNSLEAGMSFSEALSKYPQIFPKLYISLIRVGETGGLLDKVLTRLADISTKEISLRSRLQSALVYPFVLAGIAFVIVNFVLIGVLPKFVAIFDASQARLPLPTRLLLAMSFILRNYWWLLIIIFAFAVFWFRKYYRSSQGRLYVDTMLLRIPIFGPLTLKVMVSRMTRSIAALTKSGIPVLDALEVVQTTIPNMALQNMVSNVRTAISQGQSLTEPFKASGLFPPMVVQLINTGEKTGRLDDMFEQIASFYEPEIEYTMQNLTSLLEPVMLLVMGSVVAFIALSVLLPIFNLINIIKR